jgi:hypothetical protein
MLGALMAVLVGAMALAVSVYTARLQLRQVRAEVWPHVTFSFRSDLRSVQMVNRGVGPAQLEWVTFAVDGRTVTTWKQLLDAIDVSDDLEDGFRFSSLEAQFIGAGETIEGIQFLADADWARFQQARSVVRTTYCYCSVLGECRVVGAEVVEADRAEWLDACPAPPRSPFSGG